MNYLKELIYRIRGEYTTEKLIKMGMRVGENFTRLNDVILDPAHCWLIEIGNNVTMAPRVHVLCHDASTKQFIGYTKIGGVKVGNNVFDYIASNSKIYVLSEEIKAKLEGCYDTSKTTVEVVTLEQMNNL